MATYAVGDVQGCFDSLQALLVRCAFDPARDQLWLAGDLVNRGPKSLQTLRFVRSLGEAAVVVLGNHDLHLLRLAALGARHDRDDPYLDAVLAAPDRDELMDWLRRRPLLHRAGAHLMVHAGLLPGWDADTAAALAGEVELALRSAGWQDFLHHLWGNQPAAWDEALEGQDRLRVIVNALTRMRVCTPDGRMEFKHSGRPEDTPAGFLPWFAVPGRAAAELTVVCGHWSALGLRQQPGLLALDTGCVWGGSLSAVRLEDGAVFSQPAVEAG